MQFYRVLRFWHLARCVERVIVKFHLGLSPAIPTEVLADQFAFRQTGNTAGALVHCFGHISRIL